jgi:Asp-tRNA(Asn)/Glu-tRNA(Gln) amidotransferase A subunit family amidase
MLINAGKQYIFLHFRRLAGSPLVCVPINEIAQISTVGLELVGKRFSRYAE